jgi:hypothetical protein
VVVFAPLFYVLIETFFGKKKPGETADPGGAGSFFQSMKKLLEKRVKGGAAAETDDANPSGEQ